MRPRDEGLRARIDARLLVFGKSIRPLPGIRSELRRRSFCEQLVESIRRVRYVEVLRSRSLAAGYLDPQNNFFDPLKAAILQQRNGNLEEAFWLVFLFVHFGKHAKGGWRYVREIYGRLGQGGLWDWASVSSDAPGFRAWLNSNQAYLRRPEAPCGFGNHRKRESLDALSGTGTGAVIESYVAWVYPPRTHQQLVTLAVNDAQSEPIRAFDELYRSMDVIVRFGRLARFDYLCMLDKLRLAPITAGSPYLSGASGPLNGARLLFGARESAVVLDSWVAELGRYLGLGMQVLEDALCNWQKNPKKFVAFRG